MEKYKSMKEQAMKHLEAKLCDSEKGLAKYNEGYHEGYADGWDKALQAVMALAEKHQTGAKQQAIEERELKPAIKFLNQPLKVLINKMVEECNEVVAAYEDGESIDRIAEEVGDVQLSGETVLAKLKFNERERRNVRLKDIEKNTVRGYYMPDRSKYGN